jgi:hypothetical protein
MTKQKFIFATIKEVQSKFSELKNAHGADNVMMCLDGDDYFYVTFNIFK